MSLEKNMCNLFNRCSKTFVQNIPGSDSLAEGAGKPMVIIIHNHVYYYVCCLLLSLMLIVIQL